MSLSENFRWNILEDHFKKKGFVSHQIDTFNDYITNGIQRSVQEVDIKICQKDLKYRATFGDVYIPNPSIIEEDRKVREMLPSEARTRDLTYDSPIFVDIKEEIELEGQKPEIIIHRRIIIGRTPIMLRSEKCNLKNYTKEERIKLGECEWDQGGYFIIKGKERVLVAQLRGLYNQPIVMSQKPGEKYKFICDVRSMSEETGHSVLLQAKISVDDRAIVFSLPYIKEHINAGIVFKALGYLKDEEIEDIIGNIDGKLTKYIKYIIRDSYFIKTQDDALCYIGQYSMHIIKDEKRRDYASQIVENELLPHMGISSTIKEKVYFLGSMCNKLLLTNLGLRNEDDRDHYINKRVEMAGVLCCELFRTLFKKFTKSIEMQLEKKKQRPDILSIISRTTNITLGLKMSFCVPAGTMISLSNGLSIPVEQLTNKGNENEKVFGFNKEKNGLQVSTHDGLICQGEKETIKLTFEDGRTLICTPDHKILVLRDDKTTEWVEAIKIPINSGIVMGVDLPHDNLDEDLDNKWSFEIKYIYKDKLCKKIFKINTNEERSKTLAFTRILGYIMTDASTPTNKGVCKVYLGTKVDVMQFLDDYKLVMVEKTPEVKDVETEDWGKTYSISLSSEFTNMIKSIEGTIKGKKVLQQRTLPLFLLDSSCPKSVIREFLGGLFGGDGHCPRLDIRKGQRTCIQGVAFSWTTEEKNLEILKNVFENIQKLLEKVGIKDTYLNGPYPPSSGPEDRFYYRLHFTSNTSFHKYIGFRYCMHKTYKNNIASLYWRLEEEIKRQHSFIINTVNKLKENDKKMTIKKALEIAREELKEKEYILNNYYSLSSERDISKRREKGRSIELKYLQEKYGIPDAKDFIEKIGALYMFEREYATIRESDVLPYFSLKLMDIRKNKLEIVYDITNVFECGSYLANGLLCSNSTGNWGVQKNNYIRTGVSQVLARLSYGGTLSHLRRVVIPIGKEGKNSKIRQPHASQIMYLCPNECFDPETPILLWNGKIKLAKDIIVGDILIDDMGNPTRVKSTCSGITTMYEIIPQKENFMNYTVTDNHILTLKILDNFKISEINYNSKEIYDKIYELKWFDKDKLYYKNKIFYSKEEADNFASNLDKDNVIDINIENYLKLSEEIKKKLVGFKFSKDINNRNFEKEELQSPIEVKKKNIGPFVGWQLEGNGRFLLSDFTTVHNTPEGQSIGIVLNLALTTTVTLRISTVIVKEIIEKCENFIFLDNYNEKNVNPKIFINGVLVGITLSSEKFLNELKIYRKTGLLDKQISFSYNVVDNEIRIFSDEGRFIRPIFTLDENGKLNINEKVPIDWNKLVEDNYIQYVDHSEIENSVIAMTQNDLLLYKNDFCEIEPTMMMGVMSNIIPYSDHTQCIFKDEPVYMFDGTTKKISNIEIGDKIITFEPETQKQSITTVTYVDTHKTEKQLFTLETISGRKITATYDHRFMTSEGWKRLENLEINKTLIGISMEPKPVSTFLNTDYIVLDKNIFYKNCKDAKIKLSLIDKYYNEITHLLPLKSSSSYIYIISRIFGFCLTDAWIGVCKEKGNVRLEANLTSEYGAELFENDVEILGFKKQKITFSDRDNYGKTYLVDHSGCFPALLIALGITYGKKTTQKACKIPIWIMNGSDMIKREFLSGFQGGDGSKIKSGIDKQITVQIGTTSKSVKTVFLDSLIEMMNDIKNLFRSLEIDVEDVKCQKSKKYEDMMCVSYYINSSRKNLIKYFDIVNYSYDIHKKVESGVMVEYLKYLDYEHEKRIDLVNEIKKLSSLTNKEIATKLNINADFVYKCRFSKYNTVGLPKGLLTVKEWKNIIKTSSTTIFIPLRNVVKSSENIISDITVASEKTQSFLCGDAFCVHNSSRNIFQSSMGKQSIGIFALSHQIRTDTITHVLTYPQKPLVSTLPSKFMGFDDMPYGINAIVAIACYTGLTLVKPLSC